MYVIMYVSYFGHCTHSAFHFLCNLVCFCLFLLMYFNVEILFVNSVKKIINNKQSTGSLTSIGLGISLLAGYVST